MKAPILLSRATAKDLDAIERIERGCFADDAFTRRQLIYLIGRARGACYVAHTAGKVVGYLSLLTRRTAGNARIYSVAVAEEARGHGVGQKLVEESIAFARREGLREVTLEVRTDNTAAQALYARKGFVPGKLLRNYYHDGTAARRMVLKVEN